METRSPTRDRVAVMAVFALSCFALLLYMWSAFGGPVPFEPRHYRFTVAFDEATQLSEQADVRISGVTVGRVVKTSPAGGRTRTEIEMESEYAPIRRDARAILRQKTLLGETYVELTPGSPRAPRVADGGRLADGQVAETVELDEVLRTFDAPTRRALQRVVKGLAGGLRGRGRDVSGVLGHLAPVAEDGADLLAIVDSQRGAVTRLVRDGGVVLRAVGRREDATRALIRSGDEVLATTAARDVALRDAVAALPGFVRELRATMAAAEATAVEAAPVVAALRPAARDFAPMLADASALAPELRSLFVGLDRVVAESRRGLPAATRLVREAAPLVDVLHPVGRDLVPVVEYLGLYRQELVTVFANVAAAAQDTFRVPGAREALHYLRVLIPITTEAFVTQSRRLPSNRHNAYFRPRALDELSRGLASFDCRHLGNPPTYPVIGTGVPPCRVQEPPEFRGRRGAFPRLERNAP